MLLSNHIYKTEKALNSYLNLPNNNSESVQVLQTYLNNLTKIRTHIIKKEIYEVTPILEYTLKFLETKVLDPLAKSLNKNQLETEYQVHQLQLMNQYIPLIAQQDKKSLFNRSSDDYEWVRLRMQIENIDFDEQHIIAFYFHIVQCLIRMGIAICKVQDDNKKCFLPIKIGKTIIGASSMILNWDFHDATTRAFTQPSQDFVVNLMTNQDSLFAVRQILKVLLPPIKTHKIIFVPRMFEEYSLVDITLDIANNQIFEKRELNMNTVEMSSFDIFKEQKQTIKIRVLSESQQVFRTDLSTQQIFQNWLLGYDIQLIRPKIRNIVLHFHGGAWVSTSSFFHQNITRKWCKQLGEDTIVLTPDYRKAPEHQYPSAHEDCWQAYLWVVNMGKYYFNSNIEKIILTGDSAGGNMAISTVYRAMKFGVRVPDAVFLIYPAPSTSFMELHPSNLNGLTDPIQPLSVMLSAINIYIPKGHLSQAEDPFLNPEGADPEFFKKFPKTVTVVGDKDCLVDNCINFTNKLLKHRSEVDGYPKLQIYNGFCHGFLQLDWPGMPLPFLSKVSEHTGERLKDLVNDC